MDGSEKKGDFAGVSRDFCGGRNFWSMVSGQNRMAVCSRSGSWPDIFGNQFYDKRRVGNGRQFVDHSFRDNAFSGRIGDGFDDGYGRVYCLCRSFAVGISKKQKNPDSFCPIFAVGVYRRAFDVVKKWKKASFTLEAACVMPLVLLAVMGILYLCFFVHNRTWLTAAAYEAALSGSMEGIRENGAVYDTAKIRGEYLGGTGFFGAENLSCQVNVGKSVQVTYDLDTVSGYSDFFWHLHTQGESKIIRPVSWIRKVKAASSLVKGVGNGS